MRINLIIFEENYRNITSIESNDHHGDLWEVADQFYFNKLILY